MSEKISRRDFLFRAGLSLSALSLGIPPDLSAQGNREVLQGRQVEVPPSIMFHAYAGQLKALPGFLQSLGNEGYCTVTYQEVVGALAGGGLPEKSIILSFDDLTLVNGSSNFDFYMQVVGVLNAHGAKGVFGVITTPISVSTGKRRTDQNEEYWDVARSMAASGHELATHTATHLNLNRAGKEALRSEIVDSARMIGGRLGRPVKTLVLPYGNGTVNRSQGIIQPGIVQACREAGISIVVGIAGGRKPLTSDREVHFMGRVGPNDALNSSGMVTALLYEVHRWKR